ncbi:hypothetical protein NKH18_48915 [Streptomyces sp. M10(2022)]
MEQHAHTLPASTTSEDGKRSVALNEIVVRKAWRGRSVAWQLHEAWLTHRTEERVTLLVNPSMGTELSKLSTRRGATASWAISSPSPIPRVLGHAPLGYSG